jgi:hypothetical protein
LDGFAVAVPAAEVLADEDAPWADAVVVVTSAVSVAVVGWAVEAEAVVPGVPLVLGGTVTTPYGLLWTPGCMTVGPPGTISRLPGGTMKALPPTSGMTVPSGLTTTGAPWFANRCADAPAAWPAPPATDRNGVNVAVAGRPAGCSWPRNCCCAAVVSGRSAEAARLGAGDWCEWLPEADRSTGFPYLKTRNCAPGPVRSRAVYALGLRCVIAIELGDAHAIAPGTASAAVPRSPAAASFMPVLAGAMPP